MDFIRNNDIVCATMGEELGMLNSETGIYYVLDSVGHDVWNIIEDPSSIHTIVAKLIQIYDVNEEQCRTEIQQLLKDMVEKKIILEV